MPGLREVGDLADLRAKLLGGHRRWFLQWAGRSAGGSRSRPACRSLPRGLDRPTGSDRDGGQATLAADASAASSLAGRRGRAGVVISEPATATRPRRANAAARPGQPTPPGARTGGDERPAEPGPERRPERVGELERRRSRCPAPGRRLAQDDQRERGVGEAHRRSRRAPKVGDRDQTGTPGSGPSRTRRCRGSRREAQPTRNRPAARAARSGGPGSRSRPSRSASPR